MRKATFGYHAKLINLRQEVDYYRRLVRREMLLRFEKEDMIRELRRENARLAALVDARFTENGWFESVGTE